MHALHTSAPAPKCSVRERQTSCHRPKLHAAWNSAQPQRQQPRAVPDTSTAGTQSSSTGSVSPAAIQPVQCLKEWAVTSAALGAGQQTILLRKGGIREPTFTPKAQQFLLFPTSFHSEAQLLKPGTAEQYQQEMQMEPRLMPQIPLQYFATITGAWKTHDPEVLRALDHLHVYAEGFLETRLKWRSKDPLTLLELRCFVLQQPLLMPAREQYFGCFSWLKLEDQDVGCGVEGGAGSSQAVQQQPAQAWPMVPALSDVGFEQKQALLRECLQHLKVEVL